jgi:hypothetical protein
MSMHARTMIVAALWAGLAGVACSEAPPPAPPAPPSPDETAVEPEPLNAPPSDQAAELKMALLGGGPKKDAEAEAEAEAEAKAKAEAEAEAKAEAARRRARTKKAKTADTSKTPLPSLAPTPEPGLSDTEFQDVVGDWRGVQSCLVTERPRGQPTQNGALRVSFTISGAGEVVGAKVVETSNAFARNLVPCVERKASRLRFPSFGSSKPIQKVAKFVF